MSGRRTARLDDRKVLERAGLVSRGRTAQWRPCHLEAAPLQDATAWLERYRRFWDASWARVDEHLREVQSQDHAPTAKEIP